MDGKQELDTRRRLARKSLSTRNNYRESLLETDFLTDDERKDIQVIEYAEQTYSPTYFPKTDLKERIKQGTTRVGEIEALMEDFNRFRELPNGTIFNYPYRDLMVELEKAMPELFPNDILRAEAEAKALHFQAMLMVRRKYMSLETIKMIINEMRGTTDQGKQESFLIQANIPEGKIEFQIPDNSKYVPPSDEGKYPTQVTEKEYAEQEEDRQQLLIEAGKNKHGKNRWESGWRS